MRRESKESTPEREIVPTTKVGMAAAVSEWVSDESRDSVEFVDESDGATLAYASRSVSDELLRLLSAPDPELDAEIALRDGLLSENELREQADAQDYRPGHPWTD